MAQTRGRNAPYKGEKSRVLRSTTGFLYGSKDPPAPAIFGSFRVLMLMTPTPGQMLAFMACYVLLGIKIACTNGVYSPLVLGALAFCNACQLFSNRARAAALRLSDWRTPKPLHPLLWVVNVGIVIMPLIISPNFR